MINKILSRIESYKKEIQILEEEEIGYKDNTTAKELIEIQIMELEWVISIL